MSPPGFLFFCVPRAVLVAGGFGTTAPWESTLKGWGGPSAPPPHLAVSSKVSIVMFESGFQIAEDVVLLPRLVKDNSCVWSAMLRLSSCLRHGHGQVFLFATFLAFQLRSF